MASNTLAATRPHYGGTLRIEIREAVESADPPQTGRFAEISPAFSITRWEAGRRVAYAADENAPGGRPYLDGVEIQMGRPGREQAIDLELGKADVVEFDPVEWRRPATGRRLWSSSPVRLLVLVFGPRVTDGRVREALALAVDRAAIHNVLLHHQGEASGALLPQWLSGYAFLFPPDSDIYKARALAASAPAAARAFSLGARDAAQRPIAERIALNARDAGLAVSVAPPNGNADVRLVEVRIASSDPAWALEGIAAQLGLPAPPHADSAAALYAAERAILEGFRVVPLFHLPDVYGVSQRVKGVGITPAGVWRLENVWVEGGKP